MTNLALNIGYDASFVHGQKNGTAVYSHNLLTHLSQIDRHNRYTVFPFFTYHYLPGFKKYQPRLSPNFSFFLNSLPESLINILWNQIPLARPFLTPKFDIFHTNTMAIPPASFYRKLVVTILDTTFYTHPQYHQPANIDHCLKATYAALDKADLVITISQHSKNDLVKYFDFPSDKIVVTYIGCHESFYQSCPKNQIEETVAKYQLHHPFIFHLGSLEPRKNTLGLIKAYNLLPQKMREKYDLVIGGASGWLNSNIFDYLKLHNPDGNIKFLGYIPDPELVALYHGATIMAYPSFYEGFGIPVLEAMASGCPVLTSNISSLPEVGGQAALYCNPYDIEDIAAKLEQLLNTPKEEIIKQGKIQARQFSWSRCARETFKAYQSLK
jgi:alpha-1,3-rhamnosyl/mannosyltransferase